MLFDQLSVLFKTLKCCCALVAEELYHLAAFNVVMGNISTGGDAQLQFALL